MIEIYNLLFQPLTFQLAGEERGLHLEPRQRTLIEDTCVSEEILAAAKRGFVRLTQLDQPNEEPVVDEPAQTTEEVATALEFDSPESEPEMIEQAEKTTDEQRSRRRR